MRKKRLLAVIALVTALFLAMETGFVSAASLSEIREQIREKEKALEEGQAEESSLASQVEALEKELSRLETAIAEEEKKLAVLEEELAAAEEKVEIQLSNLNGRLRNMYKSGTIGFVDVLFESGSFSEFLTNLDLLREIYTSDQSVLDELEAAQAEVEARKKEVEDLRAELEKSRAVTEEQKATVEAKKAEIAASNEELNKMIDELNADADALTAKLQGSTSSSSNSSYTGGQMAWPTPSSSIITSPFGYRTHPITGAWKMHTGIDIGAGSGRDIIAASSGKVVSSGWNGGYGKCVIIDHGGGITTLYAHCSTLYVSSGQSVSRGQTIALVGTTGNSKGPHLHFEVRVNGQYVNPVPYIT